MEDKHFGNLKDWGLVLETLDELTKSGNLSDCQSGLIRILRYKGNWRLREEVLKRLDKVDKPSMELVNQVLAIIDDDNVYYDARIIACDALIQLMTNTEEKNNNDLYNSVYKVIEKLKSTPQPPIFEQAIDRLFSDLAESGMLAN